jgi:hypothetical protein
MKCLTLPASKPPKSTPLKKTDLIIVFKVIIPGLGCSSVVHPKKEKTKKNLSPKVIIPRDSVT